MLLVDCEQNTPEWHQARAGSLGASCLHEVVARTKTGWGASRANRLATLTLERITGIPEQTYQSAAMREGLERQPEAEMLYEFWTNHRIARVGLVRHPEIDGTHASPDGLVGDDGLVEIKCPQPAQHLQTLLGENISNAYWIQMQWQMRCTGRKWCDFVSYNPLFPEAMKLHVERVVREDRAISSLEKDVREFLNELSETVSALVAKYEVAPLNQTVAEFA